MGTMAQHYTGSYWLALSGDTTVNLCMGRFQVFSATDPAITSVSIDDARKYTLGGDVAVIANVGNENMHIKDANGTLLVTLTPDRVATLSLFDNSTAAGSWAVRAGDFAYTEAAL